MFIRDRYGADVLTWDVQKARRPGGMHADHPGLAGKFGGIADPEADFGAVDRDLFIRNQRKADVQPAACQTVKPVSYTHLDVYKRQPYVWA